MLVTDRTNTRRAVLRRCASEAGFSLLELLVASGLARKQRLGRRRFLFEHVHGGQRHDHLVCTGCGRVVEFLSPGIAALQAEICRAHGFVPSAYSLQINGLCQACAARQPAATPASAGKSQDGPAARTGKDWPAAGTSQDGQAAAEPRVRRGGAASAGGRLPERAARD